MIRLIYVIVRKRLIIKEIILTDGGLSNFVVE